MGDHRSLRKSDLVFSWLDTNGDGTLDLQEFTVGFEEAFGPGSAELAGVGEVFARLDLQETGFISYTGFCAAGIGEAYYAQEDMLQAVFKSFDTLDNGSGS